MSIEIALVLPVIPIFPFFPSDSPARNGPDLFLNPIVCKCVLAEVPEQAGEMINS